MDPQQVHRQVHKLFSRGARRSFGTAVEQEFFSVALIGGGSVDPARVRAAIAGRPYAAWVSFEPGGQVELSLPRACGPTAAVAQLREVTAALADDLTRRGIVLDSRPVRAVDPATPRYLSSPRYDAMESYFDRFGPAGRRMMRSTASTQVCLDWWPGAAGIEQWRLLLLAGPYLAAATARSVEPENRLSTWLAVDPTRTAFDDRLLHGEDPVAAYADFAATAGCFVAGGVADHLTTLFPPVRPRGRYLEIRFPDSQPTARTDVLVSGIAELLYDDDRRRRTLATLSQEQPHLAQLWHDAAVGNGDVDRGLALLGVGRRRVAA